MSCWVAPSLAAEMWGMPLEQLMARIRSGEIATKQEQGFTFVDVAPYSKRIERPNRRPGERERPHGFGQGYERQARGYRQLGKKTETRREIGGPAFYNVGSGISRSHGVVIMRRLSVGNNISKTQTRKKDERNDRPSL